MRKLLTHVPPESIKQNILLHLTPESNDIVLDLTNNKIGSQVNFLQDDTKFIVLAITSIELVVTVE
ncbi:MAG: hypothetical protein A6F71_09395 [Cycloclasticus sp. symbiont of Poecilosclerida sp. M]|nr:MAG: hypothetical protein A6F71_09395 [Cycloclasticus sp. symbiont of Poecilosclerida sp. M]